MRISTLRALTIPLRKYQFMESSTQKRALGLKDKIPDIEKTLETVQFLASRDVRSLTRFTSKTHPKLTPPPHPGRRRTPRDLLRAERHSLRKSQHRQSRRSVPLARCTFTSLSSFPKGLPRLTFLLHLGQRYALLPDPRSNRAANRQAGRRTPELEQLRGGLGFPSRADYRTSSPFFPLLLLALLAIAGKT